MSADAQLKSIIERILRLHAEADELKADIREVYGEAKANGYDKTALGAAVALIRKRDRLGEDAIAERETIVGLYLDAYDNAPRAHTHTRARDERVLMQEPVAEAEPVGGDGEHGREEGSQPRLPSGRVENKPGAPAVTAGAPFNLPIAKPLRPHCRRPENCGSYGSKHCFDCVPASESEAA